MQIRARICIQYKFGRVNTKIKKLALNVSENLFQDMQKTFVFCDCKCSICKNAKNHRFFERRDWDLNPGGAKLHKISSLAPYQARLSRHLINLVVFYDRQSKRHFDQPFSKRLSLTIPAFD